MNAAAVGPLDDALRLLREGEGAAATARLEALEAAGDRRAALVLGQAWLHGDPLPPDAERAVRHLERAAAAPWGPPELLLAALLRIGHGLPADEDGAWRWLARALAVDHPPALRAAALLRLECGDGVGAEPLLERAAARGDAFARHALALRAALAGDADAARRGFGAAPLPVSLARLDAPAPEWPLDGPRWTPADGTPPWPVAPRTGVVATLHDAPRVVQHDQALSPWCCDYLMTVGGPNLRRSRTVDPRGASVAADPARTSADASLRTLVPDLVVHQAALTLAAAAGLPLARSEPLAMLRYGVGQEYRPHCDWFGAETLATPRHREQGQRTTTVIAYLNAPPAGGATRFPKLGPAPGLEVAPRAGRLLRFDNLRPDGAGDPRALHCGEPVTRGEKWIVTAWFRERPAAGWFGGQLPGRG